MPAQDKVQIINKGDDRPEMTSQATSRQINIHLFIIYALLGIYAAWAVISYNDIRSRLDDSTTTDVIASSAPGSHLSPEVGLGVANVSADPEILTRPRRSADRGSRYARRESRRRPQHRRGRRRLKQGRGRNNRRATSPSPDDNDGVQQSTVGPQTQVKRVIHMHFRPDVDKLYQSPSVVSINSSDDTSYRLWVEADWVSDETNQFFKLKRESGHVAIIQPGVYLIYAQMVYHDLTGRWSFGIYVDNREIVKCLSSEQLRLEEPVQRTSHGVYKQCNTVTTVFINALQSVDIRCLYGARTVLTHPEFTFWGIVKLA